MALWSISSNPRLGGRSSVEMVLWSISSSPRLGGHSFVEMVLWSISSSPTLGGHSSVGLMVWSMSSSPRLEERFSRLFCALLAQRLLVWVLMQVVSEVDVKEHAEEGDNAIQKIAERVAANIVNLGQHIRDSAAHLLINLGYQIHQLL